MYRNVFYWSIVDRTVDNMIDVCLYFLLNSASNAKNILQLYV
jgi:hypothetical protein